MRKIKVFLVVLIFSIISIMGCERTESDLINFDNAEAKGQCGTDLSWFYKDNTLVIRGTGDMVDCSEKKPWKQVEKKIYKVIIEEGCTSIGSEAFGSEMYNNYELTHVTIPDTVTTIGAYAFGGCSALESVTIPNGVTEIGYGAFSSCSALTSVTIPESVTIIGNFAFQLCSALESLTISDGVTTIGEYAFNQCSTLENITIPNSITKISDCAFSGCSSLKNITFSDNVTEIGYGAFMSCSALTSVTIPDSVTTIGDVAFAYCSALENVTIPDSVTTIGKYVFKDCPISSSVVMSEYISKIGNYSLEESKENNGFYIAYDDGSFDRYETGGYCLGEIGYISTMFISDSITEKNPIITEKDRLVLFWRNDYYISIYPISAEIPVIEVEREDGEKGFAHFSWSSPGQLDISYRDHSSETVKVHTINGDSPEKYEMEHVEFTVEGSSYGEEFVSLYGFQKDTEVSIGIANGTALEEKGYTVNATWYDCNRYHNYYKEEDCYGVKTIPTTEGYAELDFSDIPNGKYVMMISFNGNSNYRATLLELQRN